MNRRYALLTLPIVAGLIALAFAVPAISFPTQTNYCSGCHTDPGASITVTQSTQTDSTVTYSVSGTPTSGAWAVFDPSQSKIAGSSGSGQFTLPKDGRTYRVFWAGVSGGRVSAFQDVTTPAPTPTTTPPTTTPTTTPPTTTPPTTTPTTTPPTTTPPTTTPTTTPPTTTPPTTTPPTTTPPTTTPPTTTPPTTTPTTDALEEGEELGESDEPDDGEVSEGSVELEDDEVSEHREHSEERRAWRRHEDSEGRPDSDTMPQTRSHRTWQASQGTASVEFGGAQAWSSPYRVSLREDQGSVTLYTTIRNSGSESIDAWATFTVRDRSGRPVYHEDSDHVTLAPGAATTVSVRTALATIGRYTGKVSLQMGDGSDGPAAPFRFNVSW